MPAYPGSRPLIREDKDAFDRAFRDYPPEISEFTFTNIFAWRGAYRFTVSRIGDVILLRSDAASSKPLYCPIGAPQPADLIRHIADIEPGVTFVRIPEVVADCFHEEARFRKEPDRDNADYLYKTSDLISLEGKRYDGKRNLIRRFKSEQSWRYITIDESNARLCLEFEEYWCGLKDCDHVPGLDAERAGLMDMVSHFQDFGLIGGAIEVSGAIRAIALAERLNTDTFVFHILKADPNIMGLYQAMMNEFLAREAAGYGFVNLEQDLGIEGLRRAKESYHPLRMTSKYTISVAG